MSPFAGSAAPQAHVRLLTASWHAPARVWYPDATRIHPLHLHWGAWLGDTKEGDPMSTFSPDSRSLPYRKAASRRTAWSIPDAIVAFIAFSLVAAFGSRIEQVGHPWLAPTMFIILGVVTTFAVNLAFGIYTPRRRLPVRARSGQLVGAAAVCTLLWMVAYIFGIARFVAVSLPMAIIGLVFAPSP